MLPFSSNSNSLLMLDRFSGDFDILGIGDTFIKVMGGSTADWWSILEGTIGKSSNSLSTGLSRSGGGDTLGPPGP